METFREMAAPGVWDLDMEIPASFPAERTRHGGEMRGGMATTDGDRKKWLMN